MKNILNIIILVVVSFGVGWLAKDYQASRQDLSQLNRQIEQDRLNSSSKLIVVDKEQVPSLDNRKFPSVKDKFNQLLGKQAFDEAVQLLEETMASNDDLGQALHSDLLAYLNTAIKQKRNDNFMALVDSYLSRYYDDIDVLILLAKFQSLQGYPDEAVKVLQMASLYAYQINEQKRISTVLRTLVDSTDKSLSQQRRWRELLSFYQLLESIDLSRPEYQLRQAAVYIELDESFMARDLLLPLEGDVQLGAKAEELLAIIAKRSGDSIEQSAYIESIPLTRKGNHYLVKVMLNSVSEATLMIDTGASITSLSYKSFSYLETESSYSRLGARLFNTANGVTKGNVYRARQLSLGDTALEEVSLAVLDFEQGDGVDGLLGMNVLQNFRFEIDQDNAVLYLQKR